ncbi:hypothetical protein B9Z55_011281 [Caenorhabditis nigoni]|uniref:Sdz-33 F-box domain-containing protein n=1 Tax=Caenorhabditis nigoni TaxID=1611254 RepID=A0A2G5UJD5_9PELO|nr:hypothetical protein B9Z55_011281 [Caenorhabditis nigoni]
MTNQVSNQTQRRLANDLGLNVLRAMKYHAIIAYSLVSKKALSMVQSLRLPLQEVQISMMTKPMIELEFRNDLNLLEIIRIEFKMGRKSKKMASLNDLPVNVDVLKGLVGDDIAVTISNQGMSLGEWIQHICSISKKVKLYEGKFYAGDMKLDYQSLRNSFPKLRKIEIYCSQNKTDKINTLAAQTILRAFLPCVKEVQLFHVPLGKNLSYEHIGMANLKNLDFVHPINMNFDFLFTLNVQMCMIETDRIPLRDLNRFFKLWIKGSNPRLKGLSISCSTETVPDWSVLLKGLKTKELDEVVEELEEDEDEEEIEDEEVEDEEVEDEELDDEDEVDEEAEDENEEEQLEEELDEESEESESEFEDESGEELDEEEMEGGEGKKYFIMNCRGMSGQIEVKHFEGSASVTFIVSKINWEEKAFHWT